LGNQQCQNGYDQIADAWQRRRPKRSKVPDDPPQELNLALGMILRLSRFAVAEFLGFQ